MDQGNLKAGLSRGWGREAQFKGQVHLGSRAHKWQRASGGRAPWRRGSGVTSDLLGWYLDIREALPGAGIPGAGLAWGRDSRGQDCALTCGGCSAPPVTAAWPSGSSGAAPQSWVRALGCRRTRRCLHRPSP